MLSTGLWVSHVLTRGSINKRRAMSMAKDGPGWTNWFPQMCIAKAWQALARSGRVPMTKELRMAADDEPLPTVEVTPLPPTPPPSPPAPPRRPPSSEGVMFEALDSDPLPDDEKRRETLMAAIDAEVLSRDLSAMMDEICRDRNLEEMSVEELEDILDTIRKGNADGPEE